MKARVRVLLALALWLAPSAASADVTKAQCVDANASAQTHRREGKLAQARDELRLCGDPHCPRIVRDDCTKRLDELEQSQPTLVFDVKDSSGGDIGDAKVSVDGKPLTEKLDGTAVAVDPGEHAFTFEVEDQPPVTQTIVVKEGEKDRRVSVVIGPPAAAPPQPEPPPSPPPPPPSPPLPAQWSPLRTVGLVVGGTGVVGLGVGTVSGLLAGSKWSSAKAECASAASCTSYAQAISDRNATLRDATVSSVAFIAGGALVAGGAVLFFVGGSSAGATVTGLRIAPGLAPGAASLELRGGF